MTSTVDIHLESGTSFAFACGFLIGSLVRFYLSTYYNICAWYNAIPPATHNGQIDPIVPPSPTTEVDVVVPVPPPTAEADAVIPVPPPTAPPVAATVCARLIQDMLCSM